jgi:hypothetical protein
MMVMLTRLLLPLRIMAAVSSRLGVVELRAHVLQHQRCFKVVTGCHAPPLTPQMTKVWILGFFFDVSRLLIRSTGPVGGRPVTGQAATEELERCAAASLMFNEWRMSMRYTHYIYRISLKSRGTTHGFI